LRVPLRWDHLSANGGVTLDGCLFLQVRRGAYNAAAVVGPLRVLLRKILLIWDGAPIHKGRPI